MPTAWISARVSTKEQLSGGGIERQVSTQTIKRAQGWCERNGYELSIEHLVYAGSAYKGANMEPGTPQRDWLDAALRGDHGPSPAILVEDVDRFSRVGGHVILGQLLGTYFPKGKIVLVDLEDDAAYSTAAFERNDQLLGDLNEKFRLAHRESAKKARRLTSYWDQVREALVQRTGVPIRPNSIAPFWLDPSTDGTIWEFNEFEPLGRRLFAMALDAGSTSIARQLNAEGVRSPGRRDAQGNRLPQSNRKGGAKPGEWTSSSVVQYLRNPAAFGTLRLNRDRRTRPDEPEQLIPGVFPPLITEAEFNLVQARMRSRSGDTSTRGRGRQFVWFALGLSRCSCGWTMGVSSSTSRHGIKHHYIQCQRRRSKHPSECHGPRYRLADASNHVLSRLTMAQLSATIAPDGNLDRISAAARALAVADDQVAAADLVERRAAEALKAAVMAGQPHAVLLELSTETAAAARRARDQQVTAATALSNAQNSGPIEPVVESARDLLKAFGRDEDTPEQRGALNAALRRLQVEIVFCNEEEEIGIGAAGGPIAWAPLRPLAARLKVQYGVVNLRRLEQKVVVGDLHGTASVAITDDSNLAEAHKQLATEVELLQFMLEQQAQNIDA